jgi:hypothetical protein
MSSLKELIDSIKIQQASADSSFVSYDKDSGTIIKIESRRPLESNHSILSVETDKVLPILEGKKSINDYIVIYDLSIKQITLKEKYYEDNYNSASLFMHEFSKTKTDNGHHVFDEIYEGVDVNVWLKADSYSKGSFVFYNNNIYKLLQDNTENEEFDQKNAVIFVENVKLTTTTTFDHNISLQTNIPIYEGIHVDVWYKELSHKAGQHIWHKGTVYRLKKDQKANTNFKKSNTDVIVEDVILFEDENNMLKFDDPKIKGDKFLSFNKLYIKDDYKIDHNKTYSEVYFYSNNNVIMLSDDVIQVVNISTKEIFSLDEDKLNINNIDTVNNGEKVLVGKKLYIVHTNKEIDLLIIQNNLAKHWEVSINPTTKAFLRTSGYSNNDTVYFSITAKYDPNILYESLTIPIQDLISHEEVIIRFNDKLDYESLEPSLYTTKYFENYAHEVIK